MPQYADTAQPGTRVRVDASQGLGRSQWIGTVTYNNPKSPYIIVDNIEVRKYEVFQIAQTRTRTQEAK